jgi:DNA-directed RNA polymerase subunit omega
MIEALKSDEIVNKVGGRFKLCALIQKRRAQLMDGARPLAAKASIHIVRNNMPEMKEEKSLAQKAGATDWVMVNDLENNMARILAAH